MNLNTSKFTQLTPIKFDSFPYTVRLKHNYIVPGLNENTLYTATRVMHGPFLSKFFILETERWVIAENFILYKNLMCPN